jgi:hypothetical protein
MPIAEYPRCAGYLKAMRFKLDDPTMTDYGWAVCLSENWTDEFLVEDGRVNFDTMDGPSILVEFERLFREGHSTGGRGGLGLDRPEFESLKAFFGSRGIKASALKSADDFWSAGHILWPSFVKRSSGATLADLLTILRGMSKKQRQSARTNIAKVPAKWRAGGHS